MGARFIRSGVGATSFTRLWATTTLIGAIALGGVVVGTTPSWAGSAPTRSANGSAYCKLLVAYNKKQAAANKALSTPGAAKAAMETAFKNLQGEEGLILGVAPSSLQRPFKKVFAALNILYSDLSKANFNYAKLSKAEIAKFASYSKSMTAASNTITAYDRKVCGVKG